MNIKNLSSYNLDIVLGYITTHRYSFDYMHIDRGNRLWNLPFSHISDLRDLDIVLGNNSIHHVSLTDLYLLPNFFKSEKSFCE